MPAITSANVANAIVKLVAARALPHLKAALVAGNLVNRDFEPILAQAGDTVNVPIPAVLSANDIAEGGSVTTQAVNLGNAQIVLNKHKEASFQIPDVTKALAVPDLMDVYMGPAVTAVAEAIEGDLLGLYTAFTTNAPVGTGGSALTEAVIDSAETTLFAAKVPPGARRFLVCRQNAYAELRQIARFSEADKNPSANTAISNGFVGTIKGFEVYRSQLVKQTGSSPATTHNIAFVRDTLGLVVRRLPQPLPGTGAIAEYVEEGGFGLRIVMSYQPNTLAQQFTVDCLYGVGALRESHGIDVRD